MLMPSLALAVVQVSEMDDISIGTWSGTGSITVSDQICVYNSAGKDFYIRGRTTTGSFVFSDGSHSFPFRLIADGINLDYNADLKLANADTSSPTCDGHPNVNLEVFISEANLSGATAGSGYQAVISVIIAPL